MVEYEADSREAKLARGMVEAIESGNSITLPTKIFWPDLSSTVLYVRHFYKDLWESVLVSGTASDLNHGAVILGTPGSELSVCAPRAAQEGFRCARLRV